MLNMILELCILVYVNIGRINALICILSFLKYILLPNEIFRWMSLYLEI